MDESEYIDWYAVLGVENDPENPVSSKVLGKAFRKLALKCHPDKFPNDADKAAQFAKIAEANEVLQDEELRGKFDKLYKARRATEQRHRALDAKTRKIKEDLMERERNALRQRHEKTTQHMRRAARVRAHDEAVIGLKRAFHATQDAIKEKYERRRKSTTESTTPLQASVKLAWSSKKHKFTKSTLINVMQKYGSVSALTIRGAKHNRALVMFSPGSVERAIAGLNMAYQNDSPDLKGLAILFPEDEHSESSVPLEDANQLEPWIKTMRGKFFDINTVSSTELDELGNLESNVFGQLGLSFNKS